jgi:MFS family permease
VSTSTGVAADETVGGHTPPSRNRARGIVAALSITQTVGYGTLYYAFAVFLTLMAADLHTSTTVITGAFTANVLTGALLAVPIGRWLDRHGGRALMTVGSLAGAVLLVPWATVDSVAQLYAVQIGIGAASAASLYEAAFALIIAWHRPEHRSGALLALTVVAGFASTIFLPLTGWLVEAYGWRTALLVLAAILAVLTVPLHAFVLLPAPSAAAPLGTDRPPAKAPVSISTVLTDRGFWLLAIGFTAHTAAVSTVTVHLVAALTTWGYTATFAATTAGLFGILSVTGRLASTGLQRRYRTTTVTAAVFAIQAVAAATLPFVGRTAAAAVIAVIGFGLGFGVATIAKPVLLADHYDTRRYATIAGLLVVPMTLAKATAPLVAALLHTHTGTYTAVFLATAAACVIAAVTVGAVRPRVVPGALRAGRS